MQRIVDVIKRPVISEKSTMLNEIAGRYVFEVDLSATKTEIKEAIHELFKVDVREIRTIVMHGKTKNMRNRPIKKSNRKKAIITLAKGQSIDLFQNQPPAKE